MLSHKYEHPENMHRVDEYNHLLKLYSGHESPNPSVKLLHANSKRDHIVVNINSEAASRRLTTAKASSIIACLRKHTDKDLVLVGSPAEKSHVESAYASLPNKNGIHIVAGRTSLAELADTLASAKAVLTTDSGPAHLANALGTPTVVLFGAGDESNTAPYNDKDRTIIRLGQLPCEPCRSNTCRLYPEPKCLTLLDELNITKAVLKYIH
jgi:ADP-heptose:LPS heptosyltransferase